jgi:hypothetical protein
MCYAAPRLKGAVGTARVRPDHAARLPTTPPLPTASPRASQTAGVRTSLSEHTTTVVRPPPCRSPPSHTFPRCRPRLAVYAAVYPVRMPPSPTPPGKPWCHRLCRAAVSSTHHCLYREVGHATVHAPVRPRRSLPRTASRAPVTSPSQSTRAAPPRALRRAGLSWPGRGGFGRVTANLFFYFPNIFKSLQIQKFV